MENRWCIERTLPCLPQAESFFPFPGRDLGDELNDVSQLEIRPEEEKACHSCRRRMSLVGDAMNLEMTVLKISTRAT
jgi:hypothetical protein